MRCRRRFRWIFLLALAGGGAALLLRSRRALPGGVPAAAPPTPTPAAPTDAPAAHAVAAPVTEPADPAAPWVAPVDGQCPEGYPVKANDNSGIYHLPGGRFYDRTVPERCYASAEGAEADGYRRAKA
ncbi:MAG: hypothetical protein R2694_02140 [Ilumatobacteraceae bacterium]